MGSAKLGAAQSGINGFNILFIIFFNFNPLRERHEGCYKLETGKLFCAKYHFQTWHNDCFFLFDKQGKLAVTLPRQASSSKSVS